MYAYFAERCDTAALIQCMCAAQSNAGNTRPSFACCCHPEALSAQGKSPVRHNAHPIATPGATVACHLPTTMHEHMHTCSRRRPSLLHPCYTVTSGMSACLLVRDMPASYSHPPSKLFTRPITCYRCHCSWLRLRRAVDGTQGAPLKTLWTCPSKQTLLTPSSPAAALAVLGASSSRFGAAVPPACFLPG